MNQDSKIYVAGGKGLVGSAILRKLSSYGFTNIITRPHAVLDLTKQDDVEDFFSQERPEYVFMAAAKVGGILSNATYPAEFIYNNIIMQSNIIHASYKFNVIKLLFLGSSCIYPKHAPQPIKEEYLMTGQLEPTNESYAIAKIAGIKTCQAYNMQYKTNFISVMPTNLYGPYDNFDLETSHVLPALIRKFHEAKIANKNFITTDTHSGHPPSVMLWGTGKPMREFLHVDDLADSCIFLMQNYNESDIINVGTGKDISIRELADIVKAIVAFNGEIFFDTTKPDGTPRKLLDIRKLCKLGWEPKISLYEGIQQTYDWYCRTIANSNL